MAQHKRADLDRMTNDIIETAKIAEVAYDVSAVKTVLETFREHFTASPVEFRTSTRGLAERGLSFRYVDIETPHDPFRVALERGLIQTSGRPVEKLIPELQAQLSVLGWGVDAEASHGFEKLWAFLGEEHPLERAYAVAALPPSVRESAPFCERYSLTHFAIVAADYHNDSANLYFIVRTPGMVTRATVARMIGDLGFRLPAEAMLAACEETLILNLTYTWRTSSVERLCFYVPAPEPRLVPSDIHPVLTRIAERAPVVADHRGFILGYTFRRGEPFVKIEVDYTGTILDVLQRCASVPRAA